MYDLRSIALSRRRTIFVLLGFAAALLLATALVLEPPRASNVIADGERTGATAGSENQGTRPIPEPLDRNVASTEIDPGGDGARDEFGTGVHDAGKADALIGPEPSVIDPAAAPTDMIALPELDARIIRTGSIELRVKRAGFEDAWGDVQAVAAAHGGYVIAASRSESGDGPRAGTIAMRIPTRRFDVAVDRIREVSGAKVRRLDIVSQDVTQEFVDVRSRLRHDRAVEARLLALLGRTRSVSEVLAVQSRLDQVQEQIELSKGRLDYLEKMTSMSTVQVSITAPAAAGVDSDAQKDERSVLSRSFADARDRFEGNVAAAIVWFGGVLPTLVLIAALALAGRMIWRRVRPAKASRERATPPA